jgi:hypothetical protein
MNNDRQYQPQRINHQVPLSSGHFFSASKPRSVPPTSVVFTLWLSMIAAVGVGSFCQRLVESFFADYRSTIAKFHPDTTARTLCKPISNWETI